MSTHAYVRKLYTVDMCNVCEKVAADPVHAPGPPSTTGVWVDAMLATLIKRRHGKLSISVGRHKEHGEGWFFGSVSFVAGHPVVLRANGQVLSTMLKDLGKQLEAWEARQ